MSPARCFSLPSTLLIAAPAARRCFGRLIRGLFVVLIVGTVVLGFSASSALTHRLEALERALRGTAIIQVPMFPQGPESIPLRPPPARGPDPKLPLHEQFEWYQKRGKWKRA